MIDNLPQDNLQIIVDSAKQFEKNFVDKNLLIIYKDDKNAYHGFQTTAYKSNFLHLTGVKTKLSSIVFFEKAKNSKLTNDDFALVETGESIKKLSVMKEAMEFAHNSRMTGYFSPMSSKNLYTEFIVGNIRFSLGFVKDDVTSYYVPNTLLNGDVKNFVGKAYPIEAIFEKSVGEDAYSNLVHIAKKNKEKGILSLPLSKSIKKLIVPYIEANQEQKPNVQEQPSVSQIQNDVNEKPTQNNDGKLDLVAATIEQCGEKLDIELAQERARTQKENGYQQVGQVQQSQQVRQVGQVGQARQVKPGKQKIKNNGSSGK